MDGGKRRSKIKRQARRVKHPARERPPRLYWDKKRASHYLVIGNRKRVLLPKDNEKMLREIYKTYKMKKHKRGVFKNPENNIFRFKSFKKKNRGRVRNRRIRGAPTQSALDRSVLSKSQTSKINTLEVALNTLQEKRRDEMAARLQEQNDRILALKLERNEKKQKVVNAVKKKQPKDFDEKVEPKGEKAFEENFDMPPTIPTMSPSALRKLETAKSDLLDALTISELRKVYPGPIKGKADIIETMELSGEIHELFDYYRPEFNLAISLSGPARKKGIKAMLKNRRAVKSGVDDVDVDYEEVIDDDSDLDVDVDRDDDDAADDFKDLPPPTGFVEEKTLEQKGGRRLKSFIGAGINTVKGLFDDQLIKILAPYQTSGFMGVVPRNELYRLIPYIETYIDEHFVYTTKPKINMKISWIINLDKAAGPGTHWVACFCDIDQRKTVEYYDSYGRAPYKGFLEQLKPIVESFDVPYYLTVKHNKIVAQRDDTQTCGYHAAKFIIDRYDGKDFKECSGFNNVAEGERVVAEEFGYI